MEDSLKKRYAVKLVANFLNGIIGVLIIAIVPKALGPIAYGQFSYLQQFFTQIIGFLDMGSSIAFFTKLSAKSNRKELITFYFIYAFMLLILIFLFIFFIDIFDYTKAILPDIPNQYIYFGLMFGFFTWFTQIYIKISDAYALTVSVELIKIIHKIFSLFLLLFFVYGITFDLTTYFYFHYISIFSLLAIISFLFWKKKIFSKNLLTLKLEFKKLTNEFIKFCSPLVVYSTVSIIVGLFDIWLIQKMGGSTQTGFYGLAYSIAAMCFLFTGAMTPIIMREFSKSFEQKDFENMKKLFSRYVPMLYSIAAFFGVFISLQAENLLSILTDEKFKDALWVVVIMAFYPIHQTYGQLSSSIFYATEQTKLYRNIGLVSMAIGMIFSIIFIYFLDLGAMGLAMKMILGQFIGVNIQLYFNSKFLNLNISYFLKHQIYSILFFLFFALVSQSLAPVTQKPIFDFLVSGFIYFISVIIVSYLYPNIFSVSKNEINTFLMKFKKR